MRKLTGRFAKLADAPSTYDCRGQSFDVVDHLTGDLRIGNGEEIGDLAVSGYCERVQKYDDVLGSAWLPANNRYQSAQFGWVLRQPTGEKLLKFHQLAVGAGIA